MQSFLVYDMLQYLPESPEPSTLSQGICLALGYFLMQVFFSLFISTMKVYNLRAGIRLKAAFNLYVYKKIIALRGEVVSLGEVGIFQPLNCFHAQPNFCV